MGCSQSINACEAGQKDGQNPKAAQSTIKIQGASQGSKLRKSNSEITQPTAKMLEEQMKFGEAFLQYEKAFEKEPTNKDLAYSMWRCAKKLEDGNQIIRILLKCYVLDQENQQICSQLAKQYEAVKDFENADIFYRKLIEISPQDDKYQQKLATILEASGKNGEAITQYKKILARNPQNLGVYKRLLPLYKKTGEYEEELKCLQALINHNSAILQEYLQESGEILANKLHSYDKSIPYLQKLVQLQPDSPLYHQELANSYLNAKHYEEAEKEYLRAIELKEEDFESHLGIGNILLHQQKYHEAIEAFLRAMGYNEKQERSYIGIAKCYLQLDKLEDSIDCLKKATEINPDNADTYLTMAKNYQKQEKHHWCQKWLEKCLSVDPTSEEALMMLANLQFAEKKFDEALQNYNKVIETDVKNLEVYLRIGQIYQEKESYVFAEKWFRKGLDMDGTSQTFHLKLGFQYMFLQKYEDAVQIFREASFLSSSLDSYTGLIVSYFLNGEYEQSLEEFRRCDLDLGQDRPLILAVALSEAQVKKYTNAEGILHSSKQLPPSKDHVLRKHPKIWSKFKQTIVEQSKMLLDLLKAEQQQSIVASLKEELQFYSEEGNLQTL